MNYRFLKHKILLGVSLGCAFIKRTLIFTPLTATNCMNQRIKILDGFRALAILPVVLFHFFTRWTPPFNDVSLYPYGSDYDYFMFGKMGVQFFFIISGFVIVYTLDNTQNLKQFWIRRFIRLYPTMVIASLITLTVINLFDFSDYFAANGKVQNMLSSLTFLPPWNLETIFRNKLEFEYIDGAYWSLWYEILFYILCSVLYFANTKNFFRNFVVVSFLIIAGGTFFDNLSDGKFLGMAINPHSSVIKLLGYPFNLFPLHRHLVFFQAGFFFYHLFKARHGDYTIDTFFKIAMGLSFAVFCYYSYYHYLHSFEMMNVVAVMLIFALMLAMFLTFIYYPKALALFETKWMVEIGLSSYFLYLIHQNIGGVILNDVKNVSWLANPVLPLVLMVFFVAFSIFYTHKIDKPISKTLRKVFKLDAHKK